MAPRRSAARFAWNPGLVIGLGMLAVVALTAVIAPLIFGTQATGVGSDPAIGIERRASARHRHARPRHARPHPRRDPVDRADGALRDRRSRRSSESRSVSACGSRRGASASWACALIEFAVSYPTMLVAIIVAAILGQGVVQVVVAIAVANIAGFARLTANLAAKIASSEYVTTARLMGVPTHRLALRHVLPNMAEPTLILIAGAFSGALVEISGLSFIGLGAQSACLRLGHPAQRRPEPDRGEPDRHRGAGGRADLRLARRAAGRRRPRGGRESALELHARPPRAGRGRTAVLDEPDDAVLVADGITVLTARPGGRSSPTCPSRSAAARCSASSASPARASRSPRRSSPGCSARASRPRRGASSSAAPICSAAYPDRVLASKIGLIYQDPGTALNPALVLGTQLSDVLHHAPRLLARGAPRASRGRSRR